MILLPHFTRALVARSFLTWLFLRVYVTGGSMAVVAALDLPSPAHPFLLSPRAVLLLVAVVIGVGLVFARQRNEDLFLLCLGYSRTRLIGTMALPVVLIESGLAILARA